ncbi:MAG: hypothetical protein NVS4B9_35860 [Ktedonobacteraceae bacterium]
MMMWGYDYNWLGMSMMMLGMVVSLALTVVIIWAFVRWLNNRKTLALPSMRQSQDSYQRYEQGYEPQQPPISTFQEVRYSLNIGSQSMSNHKCIIHRRSRRSGDEVNGCPLQ